jgi:release factor glutamine methyltransferase
VNAVLEALVKEVESRLLQAAVPSALVQARWLVAQVCEVDPYKYVLYPQTVVSFEKVLEVEKATAQLIQGMPLEYIVGKTVFDGLELELTPHVLIPRPETEELVALMSQFWGKELKAGSRFLDLGTGSGCLAIAMAARFSKSDFFASDVSSQAIEIAKKNAQKIGARLEFRSGDWVQPWLMDDNKYFDFVVSNPPYIGDHERDQVSLSTLHYEPNLALFAQESGLAIYRKLSKDLLKITRPGSRVAFEMGYCQGPALLEIFKVSGWKEGTVLKDLSGHERFFFIERE